MQPSVTWSSVDPRTQAAVPYPAAFARQLEAAFQGSKQPQTFIVGSNRFTVDVVSMVQTNASNGTRTVQRAGSPVAVAPLAPVQLPALLPTTPSVGSHGAAVFDSKGAASPHASAVPPSSGRCAAAGGGVLLQAVFKVWAAKAGAAAVAKRPRSASPVSPSSSAPPRPLPPASSVQPLQAVQSAAPAAHPHPHRFRLIFPSVSTSIFMFDAARAAGIACAVIHAFLAARPVAAGGVNPFLHLMLMDFASTGEDTAMISLFKAAWAAVNVHGHETRLTFVAGDILSAASRGVAGFVANAANAKFDGSPKTGGFNKAIFLAAGWRGLEADTRALYPQGAVCGPCYPVALRPTSPLVCQSGVKHILHVLGPNMNPERPNCLRDVAAASDLLRRCYENMLATWARLAQDALDAE